MQSLEEMASIYADVYESERRLPSRAGFDETSGSFISTNGRSSVSFPDHFLKSLTHQIENALKARVADFIFFPDMGHSHFFVPNDYYESLSDTPKPFTNKLNRIINDKNKGLKTLYHTAEHLQTHTDQMRTEFVTDRYTMWRYFTRNPVFDELGQMEIITNFESKANTARRLDGFRFVAGLNISANKNGCFPFEDQFGEIKFYDVSAWDLTNDCGRTNCDSAFEIKRDMIH